MGSDQTVRFTKAVQLWDIYLGQFEAQHFLQPSFGEVRFFRTD